MIKIANTSEVSLHDSSLNLKIDYKKSQSIATPHTKCRVCGSEDLSKYLDLGWMPLANNLESTMESAKNKERFPLQLMFCENCGLSQLSVVIDPKELFSYYPYRSGINGGYVEHCRKMAKELVDRFGFNDKTCHLDIAGNDGTLLVEFRNVLHNYNYIINIDPAENLREICEEKRIFTITQFWSMELANSTFSKRKMDLITATNVFAHLDNVKEFIQACRVVLKPTGVLIIENPYIIDFIENMEFDTIYFEHVTYWGLTPLIRLCVDNGMKVIDVTKQAIHGGTMRYTIARDDSEYLPTDNVTVFCNRELSRGFREFETYLPWSISIKKIIEAFRENLLKLKKEGKSIIGFAASAKGNTLLNCAGINSDIMDFIVDQTPEKIGKFSPGTGIPIIGIENIMKTPPDYIVILSWNFKEEIIKKIKLLGYEGKFIIPIPSWQII